MAHVEPSKDSTPSPLRIALRETTKNKLREEAWLQKQKILLLVLVLHSKEALQYH